MKLLKVAAIEALYVAAFLLLVSCATTPPPNPPFDSLTGITFDCNDPTVAEQRPKADGIVGDCLVSTERDKCLDALTSWYATDTVGCSVRSQGMAAFEKIANGTATTRDNLIAIGSKQWIREKGAGYR